MTASVTLTHELSLNPPSAPENTVKPTKQWTDLWSLTSATSNLEPLTSHLGWLGKGSPVSVFFKRGAEKTKNKIQRRLVGVVEFSLLAPVFVSFWIWLSLGNDWITPSRVRGQTEADASCWCAELEVPDSNLEPQDRGEPALNLQEKSVKLKKKNEAMFSQNYLTFHQVRHLVFDIEITANLYFYCPPTATTGS